MFQLFTLLKFAASAREVVAAVLNKTKATGAVDAALTVTDGKKTYLAAAGLVAYAVLGIVLGQTSVDVGVTLVLNGLGLASLRHALQKFLDNFIFDEPDDPDDDQASAALKIGPTPSDPTSTAKSLNVDSLFTTHAPPRNRFFVDDWDRQFSLGEPAIAG